MKETPIVSGPPLSLSFELGWDGNILEHAALCYELTDPSGTTELAGGTLEEWSGGTGSGAGLAVANLNDPSAALHTDVLVGALGEDGGYIYVTKASAPATGYTVTAATPFIVCAGTNITGAPCVGSSNGPYVGETGLIAASLTPSPPTSSCCSTGASETPSIQVFVDGIPVPVAPGPISIGVNPSAASAGLGSTGIPVCVGNCVTVPGVWVGTAGAPVAELVVPGVGTVPLLPPGAPEPACYSVATTCPPPY